MPRGVAALVFVLNKVESWRLWGWAPGISFDIVVKSCWSKKSYQHDASHCSVPICLWSWKRGPRIPAERHTHSTRSPHAITEADAHVCANTHLCYADTWEAFKCASVCVFVLDPCPPRTIPDLLNCLALSIRWGQTYRCVRWMCSMHGSATQMKAVWTFLLSIEDLYMWEQSSIISLQDNWKKCSRKLLATLREISGKYWLVYYT